VPVIFYLISSLLAPEKGNLLKIMQKSIIPIAHTSIAGLAVLCLFNIISGVMYFKVAASFLSQIVDV
jgi:hypothetical protein